MDYQLLLAVLGGIIVLLTLILKLRIPAFIALLIASISAGLFAGMDPATIIDTVKKGMGGTLGFVATVVGLGAMFGAILEHTGGAQRIAGFLLDKFGIKNSPLAMVLAGFLIAIPVFFDVAFIILVPMVYALQRKTGKSLLLYAIPLLAGLAITHSFIPPTPGPIAVADLIDASLGWVILIGFIVGIPTALLSGILFGKYIAKQIHIVAPDAGLETNQAIDKNQSIGLIFAIIGLPIVLILMGTFVKSGLIKLEQQFLVETIQLLGHPFTALILANIAAWYLMGRRQGLSKENLFDITSKSMAPAGTIILLTGAGGVFKQVLVDTGAGSMIATSLTEIGFPLIVFGFLAAALVRIIQGSATVAMITGAGLVAPLLEGQANADPKLACLVIAIASGASILSHVNDSGFWLVSQYLGLSEKQTFRSWTMMTTILAFTGFVSACLLWMIL